MLRPERNDLTFSLVCILESGFILTDNLSKDLQGTKVAVVSRQCLADLIKEMLTKIPTSDQSFDLLGEPTLPRKQCSSAKLEVGTGAPSYPQTTKDQ